MCLGWTMKMWEKLTLLFVLRTQSLSGGSSRTQQNQLSMHEKFNVCTMNAAGATGGTITWRLNYQKWITWRSGTKKAQNGFFPEIKFNQIGQQYFTSPWNLSNSNPLYVTPKLFGKSLRTKKHLNQLQIPSPSSIQTWAPSDMLR